MIRSSLVGLIGSALIMGVLLGGYAHNDYIKWNQQGREAFLAYQTHRFDQLMALPRPIGITLVGATLLSLIFLGTYELLALVISKIFGSEQNS